MPHLILAETSASVSELKKNPMAKAYEALMDKLEDMGLNSLADARLKDGKPLVRVKLDEL